MSGFLDQLANRAIGTPMAVRPRLRLRYERKSPMAAALEVADAEIDAPVRGSRRAVASVRAQSDSAQVTSRSAEEEPPSRARSHFPAAASTRDEQVMPVRHPTIPEPAPAARSRTVAADAKPMEGRSEQEMDEGEVRRTRLRIIEKVHDMAEQGDANRHGETGGREKGEPAVSAPPAVTEVYHSPMVQNLGSQIGSNRREQEVMGTFAVPRPNGERLPPPQQPSVHVTIGQVEIRAIASSPPSAAEPPVPASSRHSLDRYLSRRREGKR